VAANKGEYWAVSLTARTNLLQLSPMDFTKTLKELQQASAFDIYRLRAAIDRVLDQPDWLHAVQSRLQVGQNIEYFDPQANRIHKGQVLGLRRKLALVLDLDSQQRSGKVLRLNDKTVTLLVGQEQWRVTYGLLHRVVDGRAESASGHELNYIAGEATIIDDEE
jgi:hypothetical protein